MAKGGGKKRSYVRDGNGRFASTPGGGKSAALKGGTLSKRSSLKGSRAKLKAKDAADPSIRNTLSTRAQKGAVTRGNKALRAAKAASQRTAVGRSKVGTVAKGKKSPVLKTTVLKPQAARVPASQRSGSMTSTLRATMGALAKADAMRIREVESITGQKVRPTAAGAKAGKEAGARVRATAKGGKVADTLRAGLRELAQSDARTMRGMAGIVRDATPKVAGGKGGKAIRGGRAATRKPLAPAKVAKPKAVKAKVGKRILLTQAAKLDQKRNAIIAGASLNTAKEKALRTYNNAKAIGDRAKALRTQAKAAGKRSRASLPRTRGTVAKPKGLKPGKVAKTNKSVKKLLTGSDLVKKFDRLMTKQFQGVYQNESSPLKRERALIQETNPQKRAVLQRKLDKARETQARATGFRDALAEAKGLQYPGKSKTAEGQSTMLRNYKNRPRYSTKQKVRPVWGKNFIR